ncbi:MAG: hypothetical protein AAF092_11310 [Pseudomonadota bacterium]
MSGSGSFFSGTPFQRFPTSGSTYLGFITSSLTFTFNAPVAAFGFYATDVGDEGGQLTLTTAGDLSTSFTAGHSLNGADGNLVFYGIIADTPGETFTSITLSAPGGINGEVFGIDDVIAADFGQIAPVPIPAGGALLLTGLLAVGVMRRRAGTSLS